MTVCCWYIASASTPRKKMTCPFTDMAKHIALSFVGSEYFMWVDFILRKLLRNLKIWPHIFVKIEADSCDKIAFGYLENLMPSRAEIILPTVLFFASFVIYWRDRLWVTMKIRDKCFSDFLLLEVQIRHVLICSGVVQRESASSSTVFMHGHSEETASSIWTWLLNALFWWGKWQRPIS